MQGLTARLRITHMLPWADCQFLRPVGSRSCVVRLAQTGAIMQITLQDTLDVTRACMACPTRPMPARVRLSEDTAQDPCELDVTWPESIAVMPPPMRFIRQTRAAPRKVKRRRQC